LSFPLVFEDKISLANLPVPSRFPGNYWGVFLYFLGSKSCSITSPRPPFQWKGMVGDALLILSSTGADGGRSTDRV
jgi:hypothetical protein